MCKVLIVEDEPVERVLVAEAFARAGFGVATAKNGRVAVEMFREDPAALVVTDIIMPEQDGIATILALRRVAAPPKIIAISGEGRAGANTYLKWASRLGADEVLPKPFHPRMLVAIARRLLTEAGEPDLQLFPQLEFDFAASQLRASA